LAIALPSIKPDIEMALYCSTMDGNRCIGTDAHRDRSGGQAFLVLAAMFFQKNRLGAAGAPKRNPHHKRPHFGHGMSQMPISIEISYAQQERGLNK
jgi:hypothetical protein